MGGSGGNNNKGVRVYHPDNDTFTTQSNMNFGRELSSCTVFQSAKHGNREVIFIGGGARSSNTAEILDYSMTNIWEQGKPCLYFDHIYGKICIGNLLLGHIGMISSIQNSFDDPSET